VSPYGSIRDLTGGPDQGHPNPAEYYPGE
jgi:hypothetical protein